MENRGKSADETILILTLMIFGVVIFIPTVDIAFGHAPYCPAYLKAT